VTGCGSTSERAAALAHGAVAALYAAMLVFHVVSVVTHWTRR